MARARNVKPGFFLNEELADVSFQDRLIFIGLWTLADFRGCLMLKPRRIKAAIMPYDDCDIEQSVLSLNKSGFVRIYSVLGQRYLKIVNFEKHQRPHKNEIAAGSDTPDEDKADVEVQIMQPVTEKPELSPNKSGSIALNTSSLIPQPKEEEENPVGFSNGKSKTVEELFEFWKTVHEHPSAHLTIERRRKLTERLKSGYTVEEIQEAILGCKTSPHHQGQNDQGKVYDDLELICRNDTQLEKFIGYKRTPKGNANGTNKPITFRAQRGAEAAKEFADVEELRRTLSGRAAGLHGAGDAYSQRQLHAGSPEPDK